MSHDEGGSSPISLEALRDRANHVAESLASLATAGDPIATNPGGGSRHRSIPEDLRKQFIDVRAALFQRGIYDPVLVRFDTATAPQATTAEIADQLRSVAASI